MQETKNPKRSTDTHKNQISELARQQRQFKRNPKSTKKEQHTHQDKRCHQHEEQQFAQTCH